jgi:hypothetical protein
VPTRSLNPQNIGPDEDWVGNNAAFRCPNCGKVFIVSNGRVGNNPLPDHDAQGVRRCPNCHKSTARVTGGAGDFPQTSATIEW